MKLNSFKSLIILLFGLLLIPNAAYCAPLTLKATMLKFGLAMFAVVVFSVILYVGLSLYNKFFVAPYIKDVSLREDSLHSPKDKEEAIMMYISKNRLK